MEAAGGEGQAPEALLTTWLSGGQLIAPGATGPARPRPGAAKLQVRQSTGLSSQSVPPAPSAGKACPANWQRKYFKGPASFSQSRQKS